MGESGWGEQQGGRLTDRFLDADARKANGLHAHSPPLVIKIVHLREEQKTKCTGGPVSVIRASEIDKLASSLRARCLFPTDDIFEPFILLADEILDGYFDVFECDVGGSRGPHSAAFHLRRRDARPALDQKHRDTTRSGSASAHGDGEEISEHAIGDPFLLSIHNVVFPIRRLFRRRLQIRYIRTSGGFGDS